MVCEIQVQKLRDLIPHALVTTYDDRWLGIIKQGRWGQIAPGYEWIYGRCGDGRTPEVQCLYDAGVDDATLLARLTPRPDSPFNEYDQLWFGSVESLSAVHIVEYA